MKRMFLLFLVTLAVLGSAAFAGEPTVNGGHYTVTIKHHGHRVFSGETFVSPGHPGHLVVEQTDTYIQSICTVLSEPPKNSVSPATPVSTTQPDHNVTNPCGAPASDLSSQGGTQTVVVPGTVTTGLAITLTAAEPLTDRLHVNVDDRNLDRTNTIRQGDLTLQLPAVTAHRMDTDVTIESGSTLTLAMAGKNADNFSVTLTRR